MGLSATQVRFLQLTSRKNEVGAKLQNLSMQKMSLTREMQAVSKDYQNALSSKSYKWTTNSGASTVDLTYSTLMSPNASNQTTPYLLTDTYGKVVVDSKYKKYAELISPDGSPGGDWNDAKNEVLKDLAGISTEDLSKYELADKTVDENATIINELMEKEPLEPTETSSLSSFMKMAGTINGIDIASALSSTSSYSVSSNSELSNITNQLYNNLSPYLSEEDQAAFKKACDNFAQNTTIKDNTVYVKNMIEEIMGAYEVNGGSCETNSYGTKTYTWRNTSSDEWKSWKPKHETWQTNYDAAMEAYNKAIDTRNQVLTASDEKKLEFYEQIFKSIAEKGWTYNSSVEDSEYLNQMLQNNQFFITTIEKQTNDDSTTEYNYESSLASNFEFIVTVSNDSVENEALAKYEYEKSIISEKESRIDTWMENLKTEQSAIQTMLESLNKVSNDNIERTFNIFS